MSFELPYKIFSLNNDNDDNIELLLTNTYDYPNNTSFWGGYDFCGTFKLNINGISLQKIDFYFTTSDLHNFYKELLNCNEKLKGQAIYKPKSHDATPIDIKIKYGKQGQCTIECTYKAYDGNFNFSFTSNQSYIQQAINELQIFYNQIK